MDNREITKFLGTMKALFPNEKNLDADSAKLRVVFWGDALKGVPLQKAMKALSQYCKTSTSGFPPQPAHILKIIREEKALSDTEIYTLIQRALCDSTYHAEEQFSRLPPPLQAVIGSAAELKLQAMRPTDDSRIYIYSVIKEYRTRRDNGTLDETLLIGSGTKLGLEVTENDG